VLWLEVDFFEGFFSKKNSLNSWSSSKWIESRSFWWLVSQNERAGPICFTPLNIWRLSPFEVSPYVIQKVKQFLQNHSGLEGVMSGTLEQYFSGEAHKTQKAKLLQALSRLVYHWKTPGAFGNALRGDNHKRQYKTNIC
jgi:hypothetical protein